MRALRSQSSPGRATSRLQQQRSCRTRCLRCIRVHSVATTGARTASGKDPFAEKTVYKDNAVDRLFISLFTKKMAAQLPGVAVPPDPVWDDFVRVSKEIMRGRTPEQQQAVVRNVLLSLMPPGTPEGFRLLFPPTQWSAEVNARIAALTFKWLVGEMEVQEEEVAVGPGQTRRQASVVHIKKCRYLESTACAGLCVQMCKIPTQQFFTESFGLPLTMQPDFNDLSCKMIFGQAPVPIEQDPAYGQPCFVPQCSMAKKANPCPKIEP